ncbi:aminopeptidase [Halpernia sp.]|uniref:aminopeptidase n=1 Tax=Halpernia sp. TaxID=2782209 RepID=UPI003A8FF72F
MKHFSFLLFFFFGYATLLSQQDSISVNAVLKQDLRTLNVKETLIYHNNLGENISKIKLLNWISSYKNQKTPLSYRKLEDRKSDLYFAKKEDLGRLENLDISINNEREKIKNLDDENIYLNLKTPLESGKSLKIELNYVLKLPLNKFTEYGSSSDKVILKYFFLVPDTFEDSAQYQRYFEDVEETQNAGTFWNIKLEFPENFAAESNLNKIDQNHFSGTLSVDPEVQISKKNDFNKFVFTVNNQLINIYFAYPISNVDRQNLEFYLPLQLKFIKDKIGFLPSKIFIDEKFKDKENFFGNNDIKFWKFKFQLFTDAQKIDLDYFSIISKDILNQSFITEKINDHWFKNGLKTYLEIEYLNQYYKDTKLLGQLPDEVKILGLKPLKLFNASDLKLTERYGLAYHYILSKNLDQKIASPYTVFSNFNDMAISNFEMGSLFNFVAQKMGTDNFDDFLKTYFAKNAKQKIDTKDFLNQLAVKSQYSSAFLEAFMKEKNRDNFNLKSFKKVDNQFKIKIKKNTDLSLPFKLETETKSGEKQTYFYDTPANKSELHYNIPQKNADKIIINDEYIFPEKSYRDNYIYTKGLFANMKKIKFKIFQDIPNPEYNEIYINPKLTFNAYDKVLLGINFKNKSLFDQPFIYSFTPYYSTGTHQIAGSGGISYSFLPPESFYQSLTLGVSASYFHYDYNLAYKKFSAAANINFTKNPRSTIGRNLNLSYSNFDRDLDPKKMNSTDYNKYDLWSLSYSYSDSKLIHEKYITGNIQSMKDFQKISGEFFYRWEYAQNKKISFRFFGGYFLNNSTKNNLFDFGISKISNYSFSYGLLGQSETTGLLSQQFILAEGGFKSNIGTSVNQWITSGNIDSHVWKMFNIYADAGIYKNKYHSAQFIWDSGVKVKIIPDFLEIYFPIQSSLGFEPAFKDYGKRIRFTLNLNFSAITNYFRRGWY